MNPVGFEGMLTSVNMNNKTVTVTQMRRIDRLAIKRFGIPSIVLMENAGIACADHILIDRPRRVTIVSGNGNNGGDGFVTARHLFNRDVHVKVFHAASKHDYRGDAFINLNILRRMRVPLIRLDQAQGIQRLKKSLKISDAVIDAIFGTGLSKPVTGLWAKVIDRINQCGKRIVSVDVPSGLNVDTGRPMGACIRANETVTFGLPKKGFKRSGSFTGQVKIADISLPQELLK